jgi:hemerythrin-like domain-containing protein
MKPTEILVREHESIKEMLAVIDAICVRLETGERVDPEHLEKVVEFIRTFADKCHHGKEENLLFKELEAAGIPNEGGPVGTMLLEHDTGRGYVRSMHEAVAAYREGDEEAKVRFVQNGRAYSGLLSQHIFKEDNVLYPMADMHLSPSKQEELLEAFEHVEHEEIGEDVHRRMLDLLENLKSIYLR